MNKENSEKKARYMALAVTFAAAVLSWAILLFCGLYRPFPPPPEYGLEVNLGYSPTGTGSLQAMDPSAAPQAAAPEPSAANREEAVTVSDPEAPALPEAAPEPVQPSPKREREPEQVEKKPAEPELNPLALYPGKRKGTAGDRADPSLEVISEAGRCFDTAPCDFVEGEREGVSFPGAAFGAVSGLHGLRNDNSNLRDLNLTRKVVKKVLTKMVVNDMLIMTRKVVKMKSIFVMTNQNNFR